MVRNEAPPVEGAGEFGVHSDLKSNRSCSGRQPARRSRQSCPHRSPIPRRARPNPAPRTRRIDRRGGPPPREAAGPLPRMGARAPLLCCHNRRGRGRGRPGAWRPAAGRRASVRARGGGRPPSAWRRVATGAAAAGRELRTRDGRVGAVAAGVGTAARRSDWRPPWLHDGVRCGRRSATGIRRAPLPSSSSFSWITCVADGQTSEKERERQRQAISLLTA